jgi:microcystin-dependent protein
LACKGQSLPIAQYDTLYAVIGTTYGGDGVQTFALPDLQGRVAIGQGQGQSMPNYMLGQKAGEEDHTLTELEMPTHSHALMSSTVTATTAAPAQTVHLGTASATYLYAPVANAAPYEVMAPCVSSAGTSVSHENMMPTLVCNYCICFAGIYPSSS